MGRRVPDKIITSAPTVGEFASSLSTKLKEKPPNVAKVLAKHEKRGNLPANIRFSSKRETRADHDEDLGRKKAITEELFNRGLIIPKQKRQKKPSKTVTPKAIE